MSDPVPRRTPAELIGIHLEREVGLHRRLIALAEAKCAALVANDTARLEDCTQRERSSVSELNALRPVRERLVKGLAQHFGLTGTPALSAVIARLGAGAAELEARRGELLELAVRLRDLTATNQELLRSGLRVVDGLLGLLVGAGPAVGGYDRRGSVERPGASGLVNLSG
jgi:hypothetical protein